VQEGWLPKWLCKLSAGQKRVDTVALLWECEWLQMKRSCSSQRLLLQLKAAEFAHSVPQVP